jgi:hypothetical protein
MVKSRTSKRMTPLRITAALLVFLGMAASQSDLRSDVAPQILTACAAFAPDGTSATVTVDAAGLSLEFTSPFGKVPRLTEALRYPMPRMPVAKPAYGCEAYFDQMSDLVAIGVDNGLFDGQLQIVVANLKTFNWVGVWAVERKSGFFSPRLAGFLEATTSLAVVGNPPSADGRGIQHGSLATLLFDPTGKQLMPAPTMRVYENDPQSLPTYFPDARHNRLWIFRCALVSASSARQPLCPIELVPLTGDELASSVFTPSIQGKKRTDLWFYPVSFAALNSDTILIAEANALWRVNMQAKAVDRLMLPKRQHFPTFEGIYDATAISPDGQVIAVPLTLSAVAFPYLVDNYVYKATDIAVVQVHPFQLVSVVSHGHAVYKPAFAIDHRNGKITVLAYRQDHWDHTELNDSLPH